MRPNYSIVVAGKKHVGKSTGLAKLAKKYSEDTGKRVLVINVNGSPAYDEFQEITYKDFPHWIRGVKQFYDTDTEKMINFLANYYTGKNQFHGMIIFEDCTKYIEGNPPKKIRSMLVDHRMLDADVVFTFHALKAIPPFFWIMTDYVILRKTKDIIFKPNGENHKNYSWYDARIPNFPEIAEAHKKVMKSKNQYIEITIPTEV